MREGMFGRRSPSQEDMKFSREVDKTRASREAEPVKVEEEEKKVREAGEADLMPSWFESGTKAVQSESQRKQDISDEIKGVSGRRAA